MSLKKLRDAGRLVTYVLPVKFFPTENEIYPVIDTVRSQDRYVIAYDRRQL